MDSKIENSSKLVVRYFLVNLLNFKYWKVETDITDLETLSFKPNIQSSIKSYVISIFKFILDSVVKKRNSSMLLRVIIIYGIFENKLIHQLRDTEIY